MARPGESIHASAARLGVRILSLSVVIALACACGGCTTASKRSHADGQIYQLNEQAIAKRTEALALARQAGDHLEADEQDKARASATEALRLDPYCFVAHNNLGIVYLRERSYASAAQTFRDASRYEPGAYQPHYNLGSLLQEVGRWQEATVEYEAALIRNPGHLATVEQLAQCYILLGKQPGPAHELLTQATRIETRPTWVEWLHGQLSILQGPGAVHGTPLGKAE